MKIKPLNGNILAIPLKPSEIKQYTGKTLLDVETRNIGVLSYAKVIDAKDTSEFPIGSIILYQKLASHNTNFGDPRQVLIPIEQVEAKLEGDKNVTNANQAA